mgnify:CR=1 FL=1
MNTAAKSRIYSAVQPTGNLHLGNYLGAIRNWVGLQADYDCIYNLADLHAITEQQDPATLRAHTRSVAACLLGAGIDPSRSVLFVQSQVPAHAELAWIFNCVTRLGWLNRMTQFKDKAGKHRENASVGLYVYPNLMAADILLYKATHVPVGEDQRQHLELCRDIAQSFNSQYETDIFPLVKPLVLGVAARVMSLRDGTRKMSKSEPSEASRINLTDTAEQIQQKIRKARTDPDPLPVDPKGLDGRPEARNLVGIYAALSNKTPADVCTEFDGAQFSTFKEALVDLTVSALAPITREMTQLLDDSGHIEQVLADGAIRARDLAAPVLAEVKDVVGFYRARGVPNSS